MSDLASIVERAAEDGIDRTGNTSNAENLGFIVGMKTALATIPDGWAKLDGEWVQVEEVGTITRDAIGVPTTGGEPLYGIKREGGAEWRP